MRRHLRTSTTLSRKCARMALLLAVLTGLAVDPDPSAAQAPLDFFGSHYGSGRMPSLQPRAWFTFSAMQLTQYDRSWDPLKAPVRNPVPFLEYSELETTVGYNYLTLGGEMMVGHLFTNMPLTIAASFHGGRTKDQFAVRWIQDRIHDYLDAPYVYRGHVSDGVRLVGADVQALAWPGSGGLAFGLHGSLGSFHREFGFSAFYQVGGKPSDWRAAASLRGAIVGSSRIKPVLVARTLDPGYVAAQATVEFRKSLGVSLWYSSGIFKNETDFLGSFYFAADLGQGWRVRFEFVNDVVNGLGYEDRDRGPTGGGRFGVAYTF